MDLDFSPVFDSWSFLLEGLYVTVKLTVAAFIIGGTFGLLLALGRMSTFSPLRIACAALINFVLATPVIVHLFVLYYALPIFFGYSPPGFEVVVLVLGLNQTVIMAENYRAGLQAVPPGIRDAAHVLGMGRTQTLRYVLVPLALRYTVPPMTSSVVNLIKDSSIATFIGVVDLTDVGRKVALESFRPIEVFSAIALGYFVVSYPIVLLSDYLERRLRAPLLRT